MSEGKETTSDLVIFLSQILKIPIHICIEYSSKYDTNGDSVVLCLRNIIAGETENNVNPEHCARIEQFLNRCSSSVNTTDKHLINKLNWKYIVLRITMKIKLINLSKTK